MELEVLRKKISTYRGEGGRVRITDDQLLLEILNAWEQWTGNSDEFYRQLGSSRTGMASIIGKAKKLRREGHFPVEEFKELKVAGSVGVLGSGCPNIELCLDNGKLVRFSEVDLLIDFLKKAA